ncbi:MAG: DUF3732 domain-containing protein [Alphaproteobacteria bacterium]|nr:DUF3732 domain-containing protein [Alphaproteobacteria bacterium]
MQFQILKLIIWPKKINFEPQIVEFKLGTVNVITGASRTGKSAIIPIIDYCLASSDCHIPIDTIRTNALWYGVVIHTDEGQMLIARAVPNGDKPSRDFYLQRGNLVFIPKTIENGNEKIDGIKHILNAIAGVSSLNLHGTADNVPLQGRLGFRDLMALVFQNQDIIANQNIIFYKTHAVEHRQRLRHWFPYILGAENSKTLEARHRLDYLRKQLNGLIREKSKIEKISIKWFSNMTGYLNVAAEYGLLKAAFSRESEPEYLLELAKGVVDDIPNYSRTTSSDIKISNGELIRFNRESSKLSSDIASVKKRLSDVERLKIGLIEYSGSVAKRNERLHLSKWLKDVAQKTEICPACGSNDHPSANSELSQIAVVFEEQENLAGNVQIIPESFAREEGLLKMEMDRLLKEKFAGQKRFDQVLAKNKAARDSFHTQQKMFLFLGRLQASLETFGELLSGAELDDPIEELEKEIKELEGIVDLAAIQAKVEAAEKKISQKMLTYLAELDVEEQYREVAPIFDSKELNIKVLSEDGFWHFLAEVGSASNWVSFHLALMCSLQEFFLTQDNSPIPNFVIIDQPSQVYFPKLSRGKELDDAREDIPDEDVIAVKWMFSALANSIISSGNSWQCIILDHVDSEIYGDIDGIHEVAVWRDGEKLIPEEWITAK